MTDPLYLDLGCGPQKQVGFLGIDHYPFPGVDIVRDLRRGLPLAANSVDGIVIKHVLEHFDGEDLLFLVDEMWRVCKPGAKIGVEVPVIESPNRYRDPLHKTRDWSDDSFLLWAVNEQQDWLIFVGPTYHRQAKLRLLDTGVSADATKNRTYLLEVVKSVTARV